MSTMSTPAWLALGASVLTACASPAVGAPCLPEQVPDDGFDDSEAYIESSSLQCETRMCLVFRLDGDPRAECSSHAQAQDAGCSDPSEVERRVYCTCRCDSGGSGFTECECPTGFSCVDVASQGGPGVVGGYCVKNGTY